MSRKELSEARSMFNQDHGFALLEYIFQQRGINLEMARHLGAYMPEYGGLFHVWEAITRINKMPCTKIATITQSAVTVWDDLKLFNAYLKSCKKL